MSGATSNKRNHKKTPVLNVQQSPDCYIQNRPSIPFSTNSSGVNLLNDLSSSFSNTNQNYLPVQNIDLLNRRPFDFSQQNIHRTGFTQPLQQNVDGLFPVKSSSLIPDEEQINRRLCEIILATHNRQQYVCAEQVQQELFRYFGVNSWNELNVRPSAFNALTNLIDRQKAVTLYMQVFKQTFNICTLYDLNPILSRFLDVEKYEDALLGPLDKNPEVQRIFNYRPMNLNQSIPKITTGDIIKQFIKFKETYRNKQQTLIKEFLNQLTRYYGFESENEIGLFYDSIPFLIKVSSDMKNDQTTHILEMRETAKRSFIENVRSKLDELKKKFGDIEKSQIFGKKRTPTAVFNYLTLLVEKHFSFIPEQSTLYLTLIRFRDDELLRCLFNLSIYLGTLESPDEFVAELKKLFNDPDQISRTNRTMMVQQKSDLPEYMNRKERKKLIEMIEKHQESLLQKLSDASDTKKSDPNASFVNALESQHCESRENKSISLEQIYLDIRNLLTPYNNLLTISQLTEVEKELCNNYGVEYFSRLVDNNNNCDSGSRDFLMFLNNYQHMIDPRETLMAYDFDGSSNIQLELYSFVQQLKMNMNEHVDKQQDILDEENLSEVKKVISRKFAISSSSRTMNNILEKVQKQRHKTVSPMIRFEECVLDAHGLNQLNVHPLSLDIDSKQLCCLILQCPLMIDIHMWFQWQFLFQPRYGPLKSYLNDNQHYLKDLRLLETSTGELFRLPSSASKHTFKCQLEQMRIRSAVGHLCALIMEEDSITQISLIDYQKSVESWYLELRSAAIIQDYQFNPLQFVLDFLMHLPPIIGQSRIIKEIILPPLDTVFVDDDSITKINSRAKIWKLANFQQRIKLELWGHLINIEEWKNNDKWTVSKETIEESPIKLKPSLENTCDSSNLDRTVQLTDIRNIQTKVTPTIQSDSTLNCSDLNYANDNDDSALDAFQHIESIRQGLGVGAKLDSSSQSIIKNVLGMLERSLKKISTDLYSQQGHFMLELIQNADDNQYTEDGLPRVRFVVSSERILVCNNEIGFSKSNIVAICNVGASTKAQHKKGYAGHKGIGFKSVFMISDCPEIRSRNYHIRFDTVNGTEQIGYIRPIWIDQCIEQLPDPREWTTCIRLPLKQDAKDDRLQSNFNKIESTFLLFLNRLRQIEIINEQNKTIETAYIRMLKRIDHAEGKIVELQEISKDEMVRNDMWMIVKKESLVPPNVRAKLVNIGEGPIETVYAVAYPLIGILDPSASFMPEQNVFAYLPIRSYGFRFILQADFEVTASREDIQHDNYWNDWLKTEMASLLPAAYQQFLQLPNLLTGLSSQIGNNAEITRLKILKYFLQLLPSRNRVNPYFKMFVDKSIELLKEIIELPVLKRNEKDETVIEWIPPAQCIIIRDSFVRNTLSQDLMVSQFNRYYLHDELVSDCDEDILLKLGCYRLEFSEILQAMESSYTKDEQHSKTLSAIEQTVQWLICVDCSLQEQRDDFMYEKHEKDIINKLRQLRIIPLREKAYLVSVDDYGKESIFFPLDKLNPLSKHLKIIVDDLPTLDEQLLNIIENKYIRRYDSIKKLLRKLGLIETINIHRICREVILPVVSDQERWSLKDESVLIAYLICIYEYIFLQGEERSKLVLKELQNKMIIKTRDNNFVSLGSTDVIVHLTHIYGSKRSLESIKSSKISFTFISDDYWSQYEKESIFQQKNSIHKFYSFLRELNMSDFLQVNTIEKQFKSLSQLTGTQWEYLQPELSNEFIEEFSIVDYQCNEFTKVVSRLNENEKDDIEFCVKLLEYFQKHYKSTEKFYSISIKRLQRHYIEDDTEAQDFPSIFRRTLRQSAWIPAVGDKLLKPTDIYCLKHDSPMVAFEKYFSCLDKSKVNIENENFIENILGIKSAIEHRSIFELLMKWSCNLDKETLWNLVNQANAPQIIPCTLSANNRQSCSEKSRNLCLIYEFLSSDHDIRSLLYRFRLWPVIFIPKDENDGVFIYARETFWNDPVHIISRKEYVQNSKCRIPLARFYGTRSNLQNFFLDTLQVEFEPNIDDYISLLTSSQKIDDIWTVIEKITTLALETKTENEIRKKFRNIEFIPCMGTENILMKYIDHLYYPSNIEIANLFKNKLLIIQLPSCPMSDTFRIQFCSVFCIKDLEEAVKTMITVVNEQPSTILTNFFRSTIDIIQCFLLNNKLISDAQSIHFAAVFKSMKFICVDHIQVFYSYDDITIESISDKKQSYIDEKLFKFYILKQNEKSEMLYIETMVNYIISDQNNRRKVANYIKEIFEIYRNSGANQNLDDRRKDMSEIDTPKWIIMEDNQSEEINSIEISSSEGTAGIEEKIRELMAVNSIRPDHQSEKRKPEAGRNTMRYDADNKREAGRNTMRHDVDNKREAGRTTMRHDADNKREAGRNTMQSDTNNKQEAVEHYTSHSEYPNDKTTDKYSLIDSKHENRFYDGGIERFQNSPGYMPFTRPITRHNMFRPPLNLHEAQTLENFEHIDLSLLRNMNWPPGIGSNDEISIDCELVTADNEGNRIIGRRGEELVYHYLKYRYPNETIIWLNEKEESYKPYDIQRIIASGNKKEQFIEVKTTGSQNPQFQISIAEMEYLMRHQSNYCIYRVNYMDDIQQSTITVINRIRENLEKKTLQLYMTISCNSNI